MPIADKNNNFLKRAFLFSLIAFLFLFLISPQGAYAAKLDVVPTFGSVNVGDNIKVNIVLSSTDQSANAVSGSVLFSNNLLTLNSVSKSDSIISLWPVEPSYSNQSGTVNFEGVILNGYTGSNGIIVSLFFKAKASGTAEIAFSNASILANDGAGTQILTSKGQARFEVKSLAEKPVPIVDTSPANAVEKSNATIQIEEIKKKDEMDSHSRFLITSTNKKPSAPYRIEIDNTPYVWNDSGNHIFETVPLARGIHSIKVYMETVTSEIISKSLSFNNAGILTPVFTDYLNDVTENEYIVIKGKADPNTYIIVSSDLFSSAGVTEHESTTIKSNEKGLFTYVSGERVVRGVYTISASARSEGGLESDTTPPIKISVQASSKSAIAKIMNFFSTIIPIIGVLVLLIIIIIFGWYRIMHYKEHLRKRLMKTRALVDKSFSILEEDVDEETKIFKKIKSMQPLTEDERTFVNQFKKDIDSAERTIEEDIKNSDKGI